jgi:uncharacterized protein YeaO (DUF488 family)
MRIGLKRAYESPGREDGLRILVDRLWPRGLAKDQAGIDLWLKEIAPSNELRKWYGHDPEKWEEFCQRYFVELDARPAVVDQLREQVQAGRCTLVYAARDTEHNNAVALKAFLEKKV